VTLDSRQPVLVGVGQVNFRKEDAPEPTDLLAHAVLRAAADSGGDILNSVQSIRVVNLLSRRYPDPGRIVAERLGLNVVHTLYSTGGGQTPHQLVNRACDDIAADRLTSLWLEEPSRGVRGLASSAEVSPLPGVCSRLINNHPSILVRC
jgi:acetyl-CoA C-acetyltransferase